MSNRNPTRGDKVWYGPYQAIEGKQPNGEITMLIYDDDGEIEEVGVTFLDDTFGAFAIELFDSTCLVERVTGYWWEIPA